MNRLKKIVRTIAFVFCSFARSVVNGGWIQKNENPDLSLDKRTQWGIKSVAYTQNDGTNTYYTSIEAALERTSSGTVYVIPGTNPTISHNCEIKSGVTLALPYEDDLKAHQNTEFCYNRKGSGSNFADSSSSGVKENRKNSVQIATEIQVVNNGSIIVGGVTGKGASDQRPSGHTCGSYCEILMNDQSEIVNNGTIHLYGYIKESSKDNGSKITNSETGKRFSPFVIYDFKGGSYSYACFFGDVVPFSYFDFPNCQVEQIFKYGAELTGLVTLYAADSWSNPDILVIGTSNSKSSCLFRMSKGYCERKYTPINYQYTNNDVSNSVTKSNANLTQISIYGDLTLSSLSITMNVGKDITIDTSKMDCPISYKFQVQQKSGKLTINNKRKFLSGSSLTINSGASAEINSPVTFYQGYVPDNEISPDTCPKVIGSSTFINNGALSLKSSFGGVVLTDEDTGAIVTSGDFGSSVSTTEAKSNSGKSIFSFLGSSDKESHTETAKITLVDTQKYVSGSDTEREYVAPSSLHSSVLEKNKTYTSAKRSDNGYGWYSGSVKHIYGIRYVSNSSTATNPSDNPTSFNDGDSNDIVINDRSNQEAGKIFGGYYYDSELTKPLDKNNDKKCVLKPGTAVNYLNGLNHITLYAKWTDKLFDVTLEYRKEGGVVGTKSYSISSADTSFVLTNPSDRKTSYETNVSADAKTVNTFTGWKISGDDSNVYPSQTDVLSKLKELHDQGVKELKITSIIQSVNYLRVQVNNTTFGIRKYDVIKTAKTESGTNLLDSKGFVSANDIVSLNIEGSTKKNNWWETGTNTTRIIKIIIAGKEVASKEFPPTSNGNDESYSFSLSGYQSAFDSLSGPITINASTN